MEPFETWLLRRVAQAVEAGESTHQETRTMSPVMEGDLRAAVEKLSSPALSASRQQCSGIRSLRVRNGDGTLISRPSDPANCARG